MSEKKIRGKKPLYKKNTSTGELQMYCPDCGEEIIAVDVEAYLHCPYCNTVLIQDDEFDDFLLENVVHAWVNKISRSLKG